MSRVGKNPVRLPNGVDVTVENSILTVKGTKGVLSLRLPGVVEVDITASEVTIKPNATNKSADALSGTTRSNINNMVIGVSAGFEKKLSLVGVGYRGALKGDALNLSLGFSHPVEFESPKGITLEMPSQTEIIVKGCDKRLVGQVAADIRAYRPPEPYKGKGVRYSDEIIVKKEAKKK